MTYVSGPTSKEEQEVFAIEEFRFDVQYAIQSVMAEKGVSRSELADLLGCKPARVTQILSESANPTLETIARVFFVLGDRAKVSSELLSKERALSSVDLLKLREQVSAVAESLKEIRDHYVEHETKGHIKRVGKQRRRSSSKASSIERIMFECSSDYLPAGSDRETWFANVNHAERGAKAA